MNLVIQLLNVLLEITPDIRFAVQIRADNNALLLYVNYPMDSYLKEKIIRGYEDSLIMSFFDEIQECYCFIFKLENVFAHFMSVNEL